MGDAAPVGRIPAPGAATRIRLHELGLRRDGEEWIVGRMATGRFIAVPDIGARAVELLRDGLTAEEVAAELESAAGEEIDVPDFIQSLLDLEFVAEVDGRPVGTPAPPKASFPGILPRHVQFALHPLPAILVGALVITAVTVLLRNPGLTPGYRDLLWSPHGSLVIGFGAGVGWTLLLGHEGAHLVTARATGVPGRIRLGTRLQFLVMQTDISGIELAPRRHRITAYLAGIAVNLSVASIAFLLLATTDSAAASRILAALVLLAVLPLPFQFMVFMRTDLYFVLADLTGCRDLYGDGRAYAAYVARRAKHLLTRRGSPPGDPSLRLPRKERRAVRVYSAVLVAGTTLCLAFLAVVTLPADVTLLARAATGLGPDHSAMENLDALAVLVALGGIHVLWAVTWWRKRYGRHGRRR